MDLSIFYTLMVESVQMYTICFLLSSCWCKLY